MKKILCFAVLCISTVYSVFAMKKSTGDEIVVFAAASLTETLTEIKAIFESSHKNVNIIYNFDSSGTLQKQIENKASCDLFISAAKKQMDALQSKELIDPSTRVDLLENKTVLAVHPDNEKKLTGFADLFERLKNKSVFISIGNSDVPVGQYTVKIFEYFGLNISQFASQMTQAGNVKEVVLQVANKSVDAGIIYATDCTSAKLIAIDTASSEMTGGRVVYPAALTKSGTDNALAREFLNFLCSDDCKSVFESVGFSVLQ